LRAVFPRIAAQRAFRVVALGKESELGGDRRAHADGHPAAVRPRVTHRNARWAAIRGNTARSQRVTHDVASSILEAKDALAQRGGGDQPGQVRAVVEPVTFIGAEKPSTVFQEGDRAPSVATEAIIYGV